MEADAVVALPGQFNVANALGAIVILLVGLWLSGKADQIVVTSRFRFTKSEGMQATMTNSGG